MKFVLCEDEPTSWQFMNTTLVKWGQLRGEPVMVMAYSSAEELLFKQKDWTEADGLILDIELKGMNGMELAKKIREKDEHIPILFATAYEKYVFEGYEVGAVSYLMKPLQPDKLYQALDRMREQCRRNEEVLLTNSGDENTKVYLNEILYIESYGHYTVIHTKEEVIETRRSIGELQTVLADKYFYMPHRSYLVNISRIRKITKQLVVMDSGEELPIARGKWEAVNQAYLNYYRRN